MAHLLASRPGSCGEDERAIGAATGFSVALTIGATLPANISPCYLRVAASGLLGFMSSVKKAGILSAATASLGFSDALPSDATLPAAIPPYCFRAAVPESEDPMLFARKISIRARAKEDISYTAGGFVDPTTGDFSRFDPADAVQGSFQQLRVRLAGMYLVYVSHCSSQTSRSSFLKYPGH